MINKKPERLTPVQALLVLAEHLPVNTQIPKHIKHWLLTALNSVIRGECNSIDDALGLSVGPGEAHKRLCRIVQQSKRDDLLHSAASCLPGSLNAKATTISEALKEFDKSADSVPDDCHIILLKLIKEHPDAPMSRQQIKRILDNDTTAQREMLIK